MSVPTGFFWREPWSRQYCVVILHTRRKTWTREFQAGSVRGLRAKVRDAGYVLPQGVQRLCEASGRWRYGL